MSLTLDQDNGPSADDTSLVTGLSQQSTKTDFSTAPLSSLDHAGAMRDVVAADFLRNIDSTPSGLMEEISTESASLQSKSGLGIHDKAAANADAIEDELRSMGVSEEEILKARDEVKHRSSGEDSTFEASEHQQAREQQPEEAGSLAEDIEIPEPEREPLREAISIEEAYGEDIALGASNATSSTETDREKEPAGASLSEAMQDREAISIEEAYGSTLAEALSDPSPQEMRQAIPGIRVAQHTEQTYHQAREARISRILDAMADDLLEKMAQEELA